MVGFKWGRGGTLRAHISKRGKCRSFFNIKAKQPRKLKHYSTLDQKTQAISYILNAAERGGKDRAAAIKFQAALCDSHIKTVQKWMREFKAGSITRAVRKPTAGRRPSKCTVEEQTRIEALLEQHNYKITFRARARLSKVFFFFFWKAVSLITLCREGPCWPRGRHKAREKFKGR